jgi:hypothetical protein
VPIQGALTGAEDIRTPPRLIWRTRLRLCPVRRTISLSGTPSLTRAAIAMANRPRAGCNGYGLGAMLSRTKGIGPPQPLTEQIL